MGRKKKAEVIERVVDAGENLQAEAVDYEDLCMEFLFDYFRKFHEGENDVIVNQHRVSKEARAVFLAALRKCRGSVGEYPGLRIPYSQGGYTTYRYDQQRAFNCAEVFIDLCQSTNHSPSVRGFCAYSGIDINTLKLWKANGADIGARIWDMVMDEGGETKRGKLDDSNAPLAHIADYNFDTAEGAFARNTDNSTKSYAEIAAEMGILIEDKGGTS